MYRLFYSVIFWRWIDYRLSNVFMRKLQKQYVGHFQMHSPFKSLDLRMKLCDTGQILL